MKNIINFYYNISINELNEKEDSFYFNINNNNYFFKPFYGNISLINDIYKFNTYISSYINVDKIILNKENNPLTNINNTFYILTLVKEKTSISLPQISNLSNLNIPNTNTLERNNWEILWGNMIDYYEAQINENEKKFPLIRETFDYFIGMAENAISYIVNTKNEVSPNEYDNKVLSHNNLYNSLYDPLNIILDHKARDLAEYIKLSFFLNNYNSKKIIQELNTYFYYNSFSLYGIRILVSRIIYPSFYFKLYDEILSGKKKEKELNRIVNKIPEYENYLHDILLYLRNFYNIPLIEWL